MSCENFRHVLDEMIDTRKAIGKVDLPPEMITHLEKCTACEEYFETMISVQRMLAEMQRETIPADLYRRLIKLAQEQRTINRHAFRKPVAIYVLKIVLPVLLLWIVALFEPDSARFIIETLTLVFGLTMMFEKTGRRLLTGKV